MTVWKLTCIACGIEYEAKNSHGKWCSKRCRFPVHYRKCKTCDNVFPIRFEARCQRYCRQPCVAPIRNRWHTIVRQPRKWVIDEQESLEEIRAWLRETSGQRL